MTPNQTSLSFCHSFSEEPRCSFMDLENELCRLSPRCTFTHNTSIHPPIQYVFSPPDLKFCLFPLNSLSILLLPSFLFLVTPSPSPGTLTVAHWCRLIDFHTWTPTHIYLQNWGVHIEATFLILCWNFERLWHDWMMIYWWISFNVWKYLQSIYYYFSNNTFSLSWEGRWMTDTSW